MALLGIAKGSLVDSPGWGEVGLLATLAMACVWAGIRVWQGKPVNRRSSLEVEDRLWFLSITLLPAGIMFGALALVAFLAQVAGDAEDGMRAFVMTVQVLAAVIAFSAGVIGVSLGVSGRPRFCTPRRFRDDVRK